MDHFKLARMESQKRAAAAQRAGKFSSKSFQAPSSPEAQEAKRGAIEECVDPGAERKRKKVAVRDAMALTFEIVARERLNTCSSAEGVSWGA